jgi:aminotransferase
MKNISYIVSSLPPSGIRKFFDIVSTMKDVISLGVGEPDFQTPWRIRETGIYTLEKGYTTYTSNSGLLELRAAISAYLQKLYGLHYNPETQILITVGVSQGLDIAIRALLNPEDQVIMHQPSYVAYLPNIKLAGGVPVVIPTNETNGFQVTASQIKKHITQKTKAIILNYPNNPTGAVLEKDNLRNIARVIKDNDIYCLSDEVYDRLTYFGRHTCFPLLPEMKDRTVLLNGFSKAFAMTGWRLGYAAGPEHIISAMTRISQYTMLCAPTISQYAAVEALNNSNSDVENMIEEYNKRRRYIYARIRQMGLRCFQPRGAFYIFPCIKSTGLKSFEFCERLLKQEKVATVPGDAFGPCGEGYIRCSYATEMDLIRIAMDRMERFLNRLRKTGTG